MKKIIIAIVLLAILTGSCKKANKGHQCPYRLCPYKGLVKFDGARSDDPVGSDGYYLDMLHFDNPELDYDQLEDLLFFQDNQ